MFETGHFATLWRQMAARLGLDIEFVPGDWRHGVDPARSRKSSPADREHRIKAVCVVHNETSTGVTSRIPEIRAAIDEARHPALLMVDTISSLASIDYRHDEWGVDVTVAGSQKGLMLPPGLGFNAVSDKALAAAKTAQAARAPTGTGRRCARPATPASSPIRRRPTCCSGCARRCTCCSTRRGCRRSSAAIRATPRRRGAPSPAGASKCCAPTRASIPAR